MEHIISISPFIINIILIIFIYYLNKRVDVLENKVKNLEINNIGEE